MITFTQSDFLQYVVIESARMSYPGSMSRGTKPVVTKGTKASLESYFRDTFPIRSVWSAAERIATHYEEWHATRVREIASHIAQNVSPHNDPESVAAKFLNTFMHQLMKYEFSRPLFSHLHLPLDRRVFKKLLDIQAPALTQFQGEFRKSPYSLPYGTHVAIQQCLWNLIEVLNDRRGAEITFTSRIQLNSLWL